MNENNEYLFDLIQSIQSKLNKTDSNENTEQETLKSEQEKSTSTTENLCDSESCSVVSSLMNKTNEQESSTNASSFNIESILNMLGNNGSKNSDSDGFNFDAETIQNAAKMFSGATKEDPRKKLLLSLKPFLRESRQEKINSYITYLTIASTLGIFDDKGSDT